MKKSYSNAVLLILGFGILGYAFYNRNNGKPIRTLPFYGNKDVVKGKDTLYHKVGDFKFYDQTGKEITQKNLEGKIYVTDFFFTTCKSICPVMTTQMQRVYERYKNNKDVKILSHTVDPETDSIPVMATYAKIHKAEGDKWHFLTGKKEELYKIARTGYLLDAEEGDGGPDDFIHTPNFALIDKEKHIRGYYDGTDSNEVSRLLVDIEILLASYSSKK